MPILIYLLIVCVCGMRVAASWTPVWSDDTFSVDQFGRLIHLSPM